MADLVKRLDGKNMRIEPRTIPVNGAMQRDIDLAIEGLASVGLIWDWYQAKKKAQIAEHRTPSSTVL